MDRDRFAEAADNLEWTYASVGGALVGAQIERWPGMVVCVSNLPHPVGNFAVVRTADDRSARQLRQVARSRRIFNVYVAPGPEQADAERELLRAGWRAGSSLCVLDGGVSKGGEVLELAVLSRTDDRLAAARTMGRVFFPRLSDPVRTAIAIATAGSSAELLSEHRNEPRSFALVTRTGSAMGIYSLCVVPDARRQGLGGATLEALLRSSFDENRTPLLQCEESLEPWYRSWGFRPLGRLRIFT